MRLLVLGGTLHVGRCVVEEAVRRGDEVTTINRGVTGRAHPGARVLTADRTDATSLAAAVAGGEWDAVVDTWSGAPAAVATAAGLLVGRVGHYGYVSSRSVYSWPIPAGADEHAPVVDADPAATVEDDYAKRKRGGELAALAAFEDRTLLARAGLILGPYEVTGRLPWWLRRMERGGDVLCPGPVERALQYVDGRDLAAWMLDMARRGAGGAFNAVSPPGHTSIGELLERCREVTGSVAHLVWRTPEVIRRAGIAAWTDLPIWLPPDGEAAALHDGDVRAATAAGLRCGPVTGTVEATWRWLEAEGDPPSLSDATVGLDPEREAAALALA